MKKIGLMLVFAFMMMIGLEHARATTGVGVVFGLHNNGNMESDIGLSLKFNNFPVLGLKWSLGNNAYFGGTVDYWMINNALSGNTLFWYFGVGGFVWISDKFGLGARFPVGLQLWPVKKLEIFLEAAPALDLIPHTSFGIQGAFGIRYHF